MAATRGECHFVGDQRDIGSRSANGVGTQCIGDRQGPAVGQQSQRYAVGAGRDTVERGRADQIVDATDRQVRARRRFVDEHVTASTHTQRRCRRDNHIA